MRVIIAARLSRIAKGQTGIDTQDEDAREWAEDNGHEVIATIADRKPGPLAMWDRPNLKPWVTQDDYMALYDGIVAAKQDRLSRADWSDEARIRLWAEEKGKSLFIVDRNLRWPPRDADDRERWNNGAEQARREWENTSKRYKRMQRSLRSNHYFVGKRSYGYRIVESGDHKTLVIDEDQAKIVREMFRRYIKGESLKQISAWLIAEKIPTPQPPKDENGDPLDRGTWSSQAVRRILRNPIYMGRVIVKGQLYMRVPGIVEPAIFDKAQEIMASRVTRGPAARDIAILTGVIKCEHGHPMYRMIGRPNATAPDGAYYYCNPEVAPKGQRYLAPLADADAAVSAAIEAIGDLPNTIKRMSPSQEYANRQAEIKQEMRELLDQDPPNVLERLAVLQAERDRIKDLASKAAAPKPVIDRKPDGTIRTIAEAWKETDNASKRAWLLERGWQVTAHKVPRLVMPASKPGGQYGQYEYIYSIDGGELTADLEALGFPARDYLRALAELPERLGIPRPERNE